jgi:hypothetical protein
VKNYPRRRYSSIPFCCVTFEVFTAVTVNAVSWYIAPCRSCYSRGFGGKCRLHFQGRNNQRARNNVSSFSEMLFRARSTWCHMPEGGILRITSRLVYSLESKLRERPVPLGTCCIEIVQQLKLWRGNVRSQATRLRYVLNWSLMASAKMTRRRKTAENWCLLGRSAV